MLTYSFEKIGKESLYEYLYKCIRRDILTGKIQAGEKLPSKRSFARNLGVSVITVENAYAQLVAEGYISSVPKSGYYAANLPWILERKEEAQRFPEPGKREAEEAQRFPEPGKREAEKARRFPEPGKREAEKAQRFPEPGKRALEEKEFPGAAWRKDAEETSFSAETKKAVCTAGQIREKGEASILADLVSSRTDPAQFPFAVWAKLLRRVLSEQQEELMENAPGAGVRKLRQAIAEYLGQYQGMQVSEEQLFIGAGTEYLYGLLIQLLGQEKIYGLEDPGYLKTGRIYESHQVKTVYIPMDERGMQPKELEKSGADVIHLSPSHHYPTGITMPIGRRYELLSWAEEKEGRYIIEDDYDCEFRLAGRPIPPLQSIDQKGKVIYMNTFTKSLASTIRISYMVLPWELLQRFREKLGFYACTVSNFEQYTLAEFIGGGYFDKHINRKRNYYRSKRDRLLAAVGGSGLGDRVRIHGADAGLHFLMEVDTELTDRELVSRAEREGIRIACLSQYFYQGEKDLAAGYHHQVLINYGALEEDKIPLVVRGLSRAWFGEQDP